ncbi:sulfotransferase [Parahaliea mediterranea]|uniref:Sulfotransferase n=1 Tax=Parahaliea mediterranea TaxID=651086 RepID=A0A939INW0_9GAMM|nr:sulfotransferase [Parahaliea mediterranea]MBN7798528.1 sulfotransferase [Parahaliea mediterranea]
MTSSVASVKHWAKWPVEQTLQYTERVLLKRNQLPPPYPPIFILGPPRSGTTLLLQALLQSYQCCYFSNFISRFPSSPVLVGWLAKLLQGGRGATDFSSYYGRTRHWDEPYDGTKIWLRWFPYEPVYSPRGSLAEKEIQQIQATVSLLERVFDAPFVNKAQRNNGRILELDRAFPNSIFLRIRREHERVAESVLHALEHEMKGHDIWFSLRPSNHQNITTTDPLEHVCEEIFYTDCDIDRDLAAIGSHRCLEITYTDLCKEPNAVMRACADFYHTHSGIELTHRGGIPQSFTPSANTYLDSERRERIRDHLQLLSRSGQNTE